MASIQQDERGRWFVRWRTLDGRRQPSYSPPSGTKAAAQRAKRDIELAHDAGVEWVRPARRAQQAARYTVAAAMTAYLEAKTIAYRSPKAVKNLDNQLGLFVLFLDEREGTDHHLVEQMTRGTLRGFYRWLLEVREVSRLTASQYIRAVERAWRWLFDDDEWGSVVPRPRRLELQRERPKRTGRAPTWAQMDAVIQAAREADDWSWRLFFLCRCTGLRPWSQAFKLEWKHVDVEQGLLTIPGDLGKTFGERTGRVVPLAPMLLETMLGWGTRTGHLIDVPGEHRRPDPQRLKQWWSAAGLDPLDLPWRHVHGFRHGFITGMAQLGVEKTVRCALTGHSEGDTHTVTYTDLMMLMPQMRAAVQRVPPLTPPAAKFGELDRRRRARAHDPGAEVVPPAPGEPIDWDAQPLGVMPDTHIARQLGAAVGRKIVPGVVYYQRNIRGIEACKAPTGKVDWAKVPWRQWDHLSNSTVAARLGVTASTVSRQRIAAGFGRKR